jgi:hypothetical protein
MCSSFSHNEGKKSLIIRNQIPLFLLIFTQINQMTTNIYSLLVATKYVVTRDATSIAKINVEKIVHLSEENGNANS